MAKHIHIHLDQPRRTTRDAESSGEGKWITVNGAHIKVDGKGKVVAGPKQALGGKEGSQQGTKTYVSLGAMKHVVARPQQAVIGGRTPGNSATINKTEKLHPATAKRLSKVPAEKTSASDPKSEYRTHATNAQAKGQAALDLHNKAETSKDPKDKAAAAKAVKEAYEAHTAAGAAHSKIPFPGSSERADHHAERAAHYKKLMSHYGAKMIKKELDSRGGSGSEAKMASLQKLSKMDRLITSMAEKKPTTPAHQPAHQKDLKEWKEQYAKQRAAHEAEHGPIQPGDWASVK